MIDCSGTYLEREKERKLLNVKTIFLNFIKSCVKKVIYVRKLCIYNRKIFA